MNTTKVKQNEESNKDFHINHLEETYHIQAAKWERIEKDIADAAWYEHEKAEREAWKAEYDSYNTQLNP